MPEPWTLHMGHGAWNTCHQGNGKRDCSGRRGSIEGHFIESAFTPGAGPANSSLGSLFSPLCGSVSTISSGSYWKATIDKVELYLSMKAASPTPANILTQRSGSEVEGHCTFPSGRIWCYVTSSKVPFSGCMVLFLSYNVLAVKSRDFSQKLSHASCLLLM